MPAPQKLSLRWIAFARGLGLALGLAVAACAVTQPGEPDRAQPPEGQPPSVAVARIDRTAQPASPAASPAVTAPAARASAGAAGAPRAAVDPAPQRILIFGDSMVGKLMTRLAGYCERNGHELYPAIWYASTTVAWGVQRKLDTLLAHFRPTFVIVVLGSSELSAVDVRRRAAQIRSIIVKIGRRKHIWVGPPSWTRDTGLNDLLEEIVGPDRFFRSSELQLDRLADGIHPTPAAGERWMDAVADWLVTKSAVPIAMARPDRPVASPRAHVFPPPYGSGSRWCREGDSCGGGTGVKAYR